MSDERDNQPFDEDCLHCVVHRFLEEHAGNLDASHELNRLMQVAAEICGLEADTAESKRRAKKALESFAHHLSAVGIETRATFSDHSDSGRLN